MKIKRFTCARCGAPKVNPYTSPYIMCDFCGNFTDIDHTMGMDVWTKDEKRTNAYNHRKLKFESDLAELLRNKKEQEYYNMQYEYWDMYYKTFPEYLPPNIQQGEVYKKFVEIGARSSTDYYFKPDPNLAKMEKKFNALQQKIKYETKGGKTVANGEAFFPFMRAYVEYMHASMKDFYEDPQYAIFNDLLPMDVHTKMKLSMFVQGWLPYLSKEDGDQFLKELHYSNEYTEMQPLDGQDIDCSHCKEKIFAPKGSFKVYCEKCHTTNKVQQVYHCVSCHDANPVPDDPAKEVMCNSCKTVNRLITPLHG